MLCGSSRTMVSRSAASSPTRMRHSPALTPSRMIVAACAAVSGASSRKASARCTIARRRSSSLAPLVSMPARSIRARTCDICSALSSFGSRPRMRPELMAMPVPICPGITTDAGGAVRST